MAELAVIEQGLPAVVRADGVTHQDEGLPADARPRRFRRNGGQRAADDFSSGQVARYTTAAAVSGDFPAETSRAASSSSLPALRKNASVAPVLAKASQASPEGMGVLPGVRVSTRLWASPG